MHSLPHHHQDHDQEQDQEQEASEPSLRDKYADWPQKGGSDLAEPWDYRAAGYNPQEVGPGEEDTVSPVPITHSHPILSSGEAGAHVLELCQLLKAAGYPTSVTKGENPFNNYDATVAQAVDSFRRDYDVHEDPEPYGGNSPGGRELAAAHVGPYTWEALERVAARERDAA